MKALLAIAMFVLLPCSTHAGMISGVGPFTGDWSEGFEPLQSGIYSTARVFDGNSTLSSTVFRVTSRFISQSPTDAYEGENFASSEFGTAVYTFDSAIGKFGGYFGTSVVSETTDAPDATAFFYDSNDVLLSTQTIVLGNGGTWTWNGFQSTANDIKKIEIAGALFDGGFVHMDGMEAGLGASAVVPEPTSCMILGANLVFLTLIRRRSPHPKKQLRT